MVTTWVRYRHKLPHVSLPPSLPRSLSPSLHPYPSIHLYISLSLSPCLSMSLYVSPCLSMSLSLSLSLPPSLHRCRETGEKNVHLSMQAHPSWIILQTFTNHTMMHPHITITWIPQNHRRFMTLHHPPSPSPRRCATLCHASSTSWRLRTRSKRPMWRPLAVSCQAFTKRCSKSCSDRKKTLLLLLGATSPGTRLWKSVAGRLWKSVSWWIVLIFEYDLKKTSLETRMKTILRYSIGRYP